MSPSHPDAGPADGSTSSYADTTRMLDFALRWYLFGGGSAEDIFVLFGIDRLTFHRRMTAVLDDPDVVMTPELRCAMRAVYGRSAA